MEYLPVTSHSCRTDLYVSKTRLRMASGQLYDFWGLFCHNDIPKGGFIGMYSGIWIHSDGAFPFGNRYAIEVASSLLVAPPGQRPDPQQYPIAMANEPAPGTVANATLREWAFDRRDVAQIPTKVLDHMFHGTGLLACELIPRNTEIRWFYGDTYSGIRNYPVGGGCGVASDVHPPHALGHQLPFDSVSPILASPSATDDEESDPSYRNGGQAALARLSRNLLLLMSTPGRECPDTGRPGKQATSRCEER